MIDLFYENKAELEHEQENARWNPESGLPPEELREEFARIGESFSGASRLIQKTKLIVFLLDRAQLEVNPVSPFADKLNHGGLMRAFFERNVRSVQENELRETLEPFRELQEARAFGGHADFGHTCPDWDLILANGFPGIVRILEEKLENPALTEKQRLFYESSLEVYRAAVRFVGRLAAEAERLKESSPYMPVLAELLRKLSVRRPETFYEALETIFLYYELQQNLDCSFVRSLGSLDSLLIDFYRRDLRERRLTEEDARLLIRYFFYKFRSKNITANMPFSLCGSDEAGNDLTNELTLLLLDEYVKMDIHDPKIHICMHERIDGRVVDMVLKSILDGKNSFVFMNDRVVRAALQGIGEEKRDTCRYAVVGCYEPCAYRKEIACTCNGYVSLPKAVELGMTGGVDRLTGKRLLPPFAEPVTDFESFFRRVLSVLRFFCDACVSVVNALETQYMRMNPTPVFSGAHEMSLEKGLDIYEGAVKYNNSSINVIGLATAVDALVTLRHLVFEEQALTLDEFSEILRTDWKDREALRLRCKKQYPRYGNNQPEPDALMLRLCEAAAEYVDGRRNRRGGVYRLGMFSIDVRFDYGLHTGADASGRRAGETLSKNMSATLGCDRQGVTSLINSVTKIDYARIPNGTVLDLVLHKSALRGPEGSAALRGLLLTYLKRGGMALQFSVLSPEELRKAQENPEEYQSLQVRLCGWNVYFVSLSRKEQDEFIVQLESASAQ